MLKAVVTTIQAPTTAVRDVVRVVAAAGGSTIIVGDKKTPDTAWPEGAIFLSISAQRSSKWRLARQLPENHYARKNVGYLTAVAEGAECIFDTDDDNAPLPPWRPRSSKTHASRCRSTGWVNVYRCFTPEGIWPRGFPLEMVRAAIATAPELEDTAEVEAPVQQGLVNGSPDVDAIWRLLHDRPFEFMSGRSVVLAPGAWCPFNSQSTWWFPDAYPLMYLPSLVSFRMTDIWRSFIAQRCLWEMGQGVVFHAPEMYQDRNPHQLLKDFELEVAGYLGNSRICALLERTTLGSGNSSAGDNLRRCYDALTAAGYIPKEELSLVDAWLRDLSELKVSGLGESAS